MDVANGNDNQPLENGDYNNRYYEDYEVNDKAFAPQPDAPLHLDSIKLIGGAASHVIGTRREPYNDVDFTFEMAISGARDFDRIRIAVASAVLQMMPPETNRTRLTPAIITEAYADKMLVVNNTGDGSGGSISHGSGGDRWSLISLGVPTHTNGYSARETVELKFVDRMARPYQFTVDSFQIKLDEMLKFYRSGDYGLVGSSRCNDCFANSCRRNRESCRNQSSEDKSKSSGIGSVEDKRKKIKSIEGTKTGAENSEAGDNGAGKSGAENNGNGNRGTIIKKNEKKIGGRMIVYPAVVAESAFGDYCMAVSHLEGRWIITDSPEVIRGGGLLAYCGLLYRGYRVPPTADGGGPDDYCVEDYLDEYYMEDYAGRLRYNPWINEQWVDYEGNLLENGFFGNADVAGGAAPYERAACLRFYQDFHSYSVDRLMVIIANYLLSHLCSMQDRLGQPAYLHILRKVVARNGNYHLIGRNIMLKAVDKMANQVINGEWQNAYQVYKQFNWRPYRKNWPMRSMYGLGGIPQWLQYQSNQRWCEHQRWRKQQRPLVRHYQEHRYQWETLCCELPIVNIPRPINFQPRIESQMNAFVDLRRNEEQLARLQIMPGST